MIVNVKTVCRTTLLLLVATAPLTAGEPVGFWSFQPLRFSVPDVTNSDWPANTLDRFILHRIERNRLQPAGRASDEVLLRRACFDLLGLPPMPGQRDTFLADRRPGAWSRLVDRLLANPHMGERWGRHWLDVARFAESYGFEHDLDNLNAYHYRDFVIRALNDDMPFDRFVGWQLAGDELAGENPLARMATGFLAAGVRNADIAAVRVEQERYDELDDLASTVGSSLLGLSIGCARCHDHKYDPISQEEYYRFLAVFERTIRGEVKLSTAATMAAGVRPVLVAGEGLKPLARVYNPGPAFYTSTWYLRRGDVRLKDHQVRPGFLDVLTAEGGTYDSYRRPEVETAKSSYRRSRLARWITDSQNGAGRLLARVIVNRLWQHHFGRGLVTTPNDFGERGERPSHPGLLDWLATELIRAGWRLKPVHRLIVCSEAYRQAVLDVGRVEGDAGLFRGRPLRRLEAEAIRDSLVAAGDRFDARMFGPGSLDTQQPRRSVYFRVKRSRLDPLLTLFDVPDTLQGTATRPVTIVSPQALALMNGTFVRSAAASFARRLMTGTSAPSPANLVNRVFLLALGREAAGEERADALVFLHEQRAVYASTPRGESDLTGDPLQRALVDLCQAVFCLNEFVYVE